MAAATAPRTPREGGTTMLAPAQKGSAQQQPKDNSNICRSCKLYCTSKPKNVICYQPYSDNYLPTRATEPVGHDHNMSPARLAHFRANWQVITQDQWVLQAIQSYRLDLLAYLHRCTGSQRLVGKTRSQRCLPSDTHPP